MGNYKCKKANHYWTKEDDITLIYNAKYSTNEELAILLNRSFDSVRSRKLTLGITKPRNPDWSVKDIEYLTTAYNRGTSITFIAKKLGRSIGSVRQRLYTHSIYRYGLKRNHQKRKLNV